MSEWWAKADMQSARAQRQGLAKSGRFKPMLYAFRITQQEIESSLKGINERIAAQVADAKDEVLVNAIKEWAKDTGVTELMIVDEDAVRNALMREIPKRVDADGACRCGACGELVHAGDYYCTYCGQKLRGAAENE